MRVQDCRVKVPALLEVGCIRSVENAVERFVLHFEQSSERETCLEGSCDVAREFMSTSVLQRSHFIVNESFEIRRSSMPVIVRPGKEREMPLPVDDVGWSSGAPPTELSRPVSDSESEVSSSDELEKSCVGLTVHSGGLLMYLMCGRFGSCGCSEVVGC